MDDIINDYKHPRRWHCDNCGKNIVLPANTDWVKCIDCGEQTILRAVEIIDGQLVIYDERKA